jgi:hypothetical protein
MARGTGDPTSGSRRGDRLGLNGGLTARGRAVVRTFFEARKLATGFLLACGVFPEVNESGSERLYRIVHDLASTYLGQDRQMRALRGSLRQSVHSAQVRDRIDRELTALLASEATAAYAFGLAAGLGLSSLEERLKR